MNEECRALENDTRESSSDSMRSHETLPGSQPCVAATCDVCRIREVVDRACGYFLRTQYPEGYWWFELESNVTITAEYLLLLRLLRLADPEIEREMVRYLLNHSLLL